MYHPRGGCLRYVDSPARSAFPGDTDKNRRKHEPQKTHVGCWVVWRYPEKNSPREEWMWARTHPTTDRGSFFLLAFAETRREIMILVYSMRAQSHVESAKAVKVPIPEPPNA